MHSRAGDCSARGIFVHAAWQRKERRHVLFHSSRQMNKLFPTKGRSWWVGRRPQMCSYKKPPVLITAANSQLVPRNTVCQQNLFVTAVYKQTSFHAEISALVIKKYTKQIYLEGLLDQTASPRCCFKHHLQEQKYLLNFKLLSLT